MRAGSRGERVGVTLRLLLRENGFHVRSVGADGQAQTCGIPHISKIHSGLKVRPLTVKCFGSLSSCNRAQHDVNLLLPAVVFCSLAGRACSCPWGPMCCLVFILICCSRGNVERITPALAEQDNSTHVLNMGSLMGAVFTHL